MKQKKLTLFFSISGGNDETVSRLFPDQNPQWDADRVAWRKNQIAEFKQRYGDRLIGWRGELSTVEVNGAISSS